MAETTTGLPYSVVRRMKEVAGFSDNELVAIVGGSKSHIQSIVSGRYREHFTEETRERIIAVLKAYRDDVVSLVAEVELLI